MNLKNPDYAKFALVQEMMQTVDVVKNFNPDRTKTVAGTEIIKALGQDTTKRISERYSHV